MNHTINLIMRGTIKICVSKIDGGCKCCGSLSKYYCLKYQNFVCNMSLDCSIFTPENHPGWKAGKRVALCKACDKVECVSR